MSHPRDSYILGSLLFPVTNQLPSQRLPQLCAHYTQPLVWSTREAAASWATHYTQPPACLSLETAATPGPLPTAPLQGAYTQLPHAPQPPFLFNPFWARATLATTVPGKGQGEIWGAEMGASPYPHAEGIPFLPLPFFCL